MTDQMQVIAGRDEEMARNNAGGFSFKVSEWDQLDRFLVLGTEGNTYYNSGAKLAKENATHVLSLLRKNPKKVIDRVVEISQAGRAPKNDYALFVLALAASDPIVTTRQMALAALPKVARTGTHLFDFVSYAEQFRGWGDGFKRAIAKWYTEKDASSLAYHAVKYQSRNGWANSDLLRLAHPKAKDDEFDAIFRWMLSGTKGLQAGQHSRNSASGKVITPRKDVTAHLPEIIQAFEEAKTCGENRLISLILDHNLPREAVPTEHLNSAKVWEALLQKMPMTAMVRNLATMTRVGLLAKGSEATQKVGEMLENQQALTKSRIHPMQVLMALRTYGAGRGVRGSNTWTPVEDVVDSLDGAFYKTFGNVTPTNRKTLLALDVSGSMNLSNISGFVNLTPRDASIAMALVTANVEPDYALIGFTSGGWANNSNAKGSYTHGSSVKELEINPSDGLNTAIKKLSQLPFASTDCALPMLWAEGHGYAFENFSVYTDNETFQGSIHASEALKRLRKSMNVPAKLAVFGMTATNFTIADPKDSGMMDFAGFDSAAPELASQFFSK